MEEGRAASQRGIDEGKRKLIGMVPARLVAATRPGRLCWAAHTHADAGAAYGPGHSRPTESQIDGKPNARTSPNIVLVLIRTAVWETSSRGHSLPETPLPEHTAHPGPSKAT